MPDGAEARAELLLRETREEIVRADGKVAIIFSAVLVVLGLVIGGLLAQDGWQPGDLARGAEVLWWAGTALAAGGVVALGAAVYPQMRNENTEVFVSYFGHVVAHKTLDSLRQALANDAQQDTPRTVEQLHRLSQIVHRKYRLLQTALWLEAIAVLFGVVAVLTG